LWRPFTSLSYSEGDRTFSPTLLIFLAEQETIIKKRIGIPPNWSTVGKLYDAFQIYDVKKKFRTVYVFGVTFFFFRFMCTGDHLFSPVAKVPQTQV